MSTTLFVLFGLFVGFAVTCLDDTWTLSFLSCPCTRINRSIEMVPFFFFAVVVSAVVLLFSFSVDSQTACLSIWILFVIIVINANVRVLQQ